MELMFKFCDGLGKMDYVSKIDENLPIGEFKTTSVTSFFYFFFPRKY